MSVHRVWRLLAWFAIVLGLAASAPAQNVKLLNVSYDPTRELYQDFNAAFAKYWQAKAGQTVDGRAVARRIGQAGACAVIDGLQADVVTLALAYDIDAIAQNAKLLPIDWQKRLPNNSSPYTSTIVFLVRKGNPKQLRTGTIWRSQGFAVVTPNPKTSGGARWNYLAAWGYALKKSGRRGRGQRFCDARFIRMYRCWIRARVELPPPSFSVRLADVLLAWENEAFLGRQRAGAGQGGDCCALLEHSGGTSGGRRRKGCGQERHSQGGQGLSRVPVYPCGAGDRSQEFLPPGGWKGR